MRALLLDGYGGIGSVRLGEVAEPRPGPGEAMVRVRYAGINPADSYLTERLYPARPTFPHILGREAVGTVMSAPEGSGVVSGARVIILPGEIGADRWGTLAEMLAVPLSMLAAPPADWSDEQAAAASIAYLTAYEALLRWGELPAGYVLISGASGGVGVASVHLASAMGHQVIALTRGTAKRDRLLEQGAAIVCDISETTWGVKLRDQIGGRRVQLAIDSIGGDLLPQMIDTLGMDGRVSCVGRLAGPVAEFNSATLFFRRLSVGGLAVTLTSPAELHREWKAVVELLAKSGRRPVVDSVFALEDAAQAFGKLSAGPFGKVLIRV